MESLVLCMTGASALQLGERSLELLLKNNLNVDLVLSKGAYEVAISERNIKIPVEPKAQEDYWRNTLKVNSGNLTCHRWNENSATIASGSYKTKGMVIVPCTMGTIGRISAGIAVDLIERCADVHLKEGRPLLIAPRETPLNLIHLRNMITLTEAGAKIIPPIPAWYTQPKSIDDIIDFMVVRLFDALNMDLTNIPRWKGIVRN